MVALWKMDSFTQSVKWNNYFYEILDKSNHPNFSQIPYGVAKQKVSNLEINIYTYVLCKHPVENVWWSVVNYFVVWYMAPT